MNLSKIFGVSIFFFVGINFISFARLQFKESNFMKRITNEIELKVKNRIKE